MTFPRPQAAMKPQQHPQRSAPPHPRRRDTQNHQKETTIAEAWVLTRCSSPQRRLAVPAAAPPLGGAGRATMPPTIVLTSSVIYRRQHRSPIRARKGRGAATAPERAPLAVPRGQKRKAGSRCCSPPQQPQRQRLANAHLCTPSSSIGPTVVATARITAPLPRGAALRTRHRTSRRVEFNAIAMFSTLPLLRREQQRPWLPALPARVTKRGSD